MGFRASVDSNENTKEKHHGTISENSFDDADFANELRHAVPIDQLSPITDKSNLKITKNKNSSRLSRVPEKHRVYLRDDANELQAP